jgi:NAD(P)-dependent dehydrogenase (short-subunit alcohol dehydrogenase family)
MNLAGKTVVLTGATTGIGRAAALALADQPARLAIHGPQAAPGGIRPDAFAPGGDATRSRADVPAQRLQ